MYYHFAKQNGKTYTETYFLTEFSINSVLNAFDYFYKIDATLENISAIRSGLDMVYYVHDSGKIIRVREHQPTYKRQEEFTFEDWLDELLDEVVYGE